MPATPERIIAFLRAHPEATAPQIAGALDLTVQNIRHHLHRLSAQGLLEAVPTTAGLAPGRPAARYRLNLVRQPNRLAELAGAALDLLLRGSQPEMKAAALRDLAAALLPGPPLTGGHLTRRLNEAVRRLNDSAYAAHWEARAGGPRLYLSRCPYAAILSSHPDVCELDRILVEQLLGQPVSRISGCRSPEGGPPCCVFQISVTSAP